ncbi:MAG: hypothetical protein ACYSWU_23575 [Planctomycetota bacterium]|jgi:hypothetical protein
MVAWRERLKKNWINTRLAHEAAVLEKLQAEGAMVRRLVRKTQDGTLGQATSEPEDTGDMGVEVGNETTHNHYYAKPAATSSLAKAAMAAALLGSGVGAGFAIPWALGMLTPPTTEAPIDTTTQIVVG